MSNLSNLTIEGANLARQNNGLQDYEGVRTTYREAGNYINSSSNAVHGDQMVIYSILVNLRGISAVTFDVNSIDQFLEDIAKIDKPFVFNCPGCREEKRFSCASNSVKQMVKKMMCHLYSCKGYPPNMLELLRDYGHRVELVPLLPEASATTFWEKLCYWSDLFSNQEGALDLLDHVIGERAQGLNPHEIGLPMVPANAEYTVYNVRILCSILMLYVA